MTPEQVNERVDIMVERLSNKVDRLENKLDTRFSAIDAKFNSIDARFNAIDTKFAHQRILLIVAIVSVIAQIINAWVVVLSHH
jgi:hypothetical protein